MQMFGDRTLYEKRPDYRMKVKNESGTVVDEPQWVSPAIEQVRENRKAILNEALGHFP